MGAEQSLFLTKKSYQERFNKKNPFLHHSIGDCNSSQECECVEKELEGDHLKCVSDAVCKMYCHFDKKAATGKCQGKNK